VMVRYVQVEYAAIYLKEEMAGAFRMQARRGGVGLPCIPA